MGVVTTSEGVAPGMVLITNCRVAVSAGLDREDGWWLCHWFGDDGRTKMTVKKRTVEEAENWMLDRVCWGATAREQTRRTCIYRRGDWSATDGEVG